MRLLFYFGHPAKFHFFRNTINDLMKTGHEVEILINSKDVLEDLVKTEGWNYKNLFPKGRKIKWLPSLVSIIFNILKTLILLMIFTRNKKYDLFITSDLLVIIGRVKHIPSILVTDDDLSGAPNQWLLFKFTNYIFAPRICDLGKYEDKKISFNGYKALAHLHPEVFSPNQNIISKYSLIPDSYFFIRTISVTSHHDSGMIGINDKLLQKIIEHLEKSGRVVLNSERKVIPEMQKYVLNFEKKDLAHLIAYAKIAVSDSSTVCAESAVLGTPVIEFNSWFQLYKQPQELSLYGLVYYTFKESELFSQIDNLLNDKNLKETFLTRRNKMLDQNVNVSKLFYWLIINFPQSVFEFNNNPNFQKNI